MDPGAEPRPWIRTSGSAASWSMLGSSGPVSQVINGGGRTTPPRVMNGPGSTGPVVPVTCGVGRRGSSAIVMCGGARMGPVYGSTYVTGTTATSGSPPGASVNPACAASCSACHWAAAANPNTTTSLPLSRAKGSAGQGARTRETAHHRGACDPNGADPYEPPSRSAETRRPILHSWNQPGSRLRHSPGKLTSRHSTCFPPDSPTLVDGAGSVISPEQC
jgi:hypothetical protein